MIHVLLVDDEEALRASLSYALVKDGYFEQFYTEDPSRQGSGTGLGLAIARRIVEAHRGSISASSTGTGKGATYTIRLPVSPQSCL